MNFDGSFLFKKIQIILYRLKNHHALIALKKKLFLIFVDKRGFSILFFILLNCNFFFLFYLVFILQGHCWDTKMNENNNETLFENNKMK